MGADKACLLHPHHVAAGRVMLLRTWGLLVLTGLKPTSPISEGSTKSTRLQQGGRKFTLLKANHMQERRSYDPWSCKELSSVNQWLRDMPEIDEDVSSALFQTIHLSLP